MSAKFGSVIWLDISFIDCDQKNMLRILLWILYSLELVAGKIQNCVIDIKSWMIANMLQLYIDKRKFYPWLKKSSEIPLP